MDDKMVLSVVLKDPPFFYYYLQIQEITLVIKKTILLRK
jgi:hypothetical protein